MINVERLAQVTVDLLVVNAGHKVFLNAIHHLLLLLLTHILEQGMSLQALCSGLGNRCKMGRKRERKRRKRERGGGRGERSSQVLPKPEPMKVTTDLALLEHHAQHNLSKALLATTPSY